MKTYLEEKVSSSQKKKVHVHEPFASITIKNRILHIIQRDCLPTRELILLCIGTDRSTGDSFGPLVGTQLKKFSSLQEKYPITVLGDVHHPVHAMNLEKIRKKIYQEYLHPYIIAIDAGLGKKTSVGTIDIKKGPLKPGSGVKKELDSIGDMHLTGYVNIAGYMEYFVLQSTRLSLVMEMASIVSSSILYTIQEWKNLTRNPSPKYL